MNRLKTILLVCLGVIAVLVTLGPEATAWQNRQPRDRLVEPVLRSPGNPAVAPTRPKTGEGIGPAAPVSSRPPTSRPPSATATRPPARPAPPAAQHPLDPVLRLAGDGLTRVRSQVDDYTCTIAKREMVDGKVRDFEHLYAKIRNRKVVNGRIVTPFSVYLKFLKPDGVKGREVVYIEDRNNGKLHAHEGGLRGRFLPSVWLDPKGTLAMRGQRYPLTFIGIENLLEQLVVRGTREKQLGGRCEVTNHQNAQVDGRRCTVVEVRRPVRRPQYEFHIARVFIDDQLQVPIRYAAYTWPQTPGGKPVILEEYTYRNVKLNVGLTDADFDAANPSYGF